MNLSKWSASHLLSFTLASNPLNPLNKKVFGTVQKNSVFREVKKSKLQVSSYLRIV